MRIGLILVLFCFPGTSIAQIAMSGARAAALAGSASALTDDLWGESNPAAWAHVERPSLSVHAAQLYGLSELRQAAAMIAYPLGAGAVAVGVGSFGFELYRESAVTLGYARRMRPHTHRPVFVGARVRWHLVRVERYGTASAPAVSAGLAVPVQPDLSLGASASNLIIAPGQLGREMARGAAVGVAYSFAAVLVSLDFAKEIRSPGGLRLGIEIKPAGSVALRAGLTTSPPRAAGGVGLHHGPLHIDFAVDRHHALGWSPSLSVHVLW